MHDDCHPGRQDLLRGGGGEGREEYLRSPRHFKKPITVNSLVDGHPWESVRQQSCPVTRIVLVSGRDTEEK